MSDSPLALPVRPLRFGIADLWLLTMLVALHFAAFFHLFELRAGDEDLGTSAASVAVLSIALVAGAGYVAYRAMTLRPQLSFLNRAALVIVYEILICVGAMFSFPLLIVFVYFCLALLFASPVLIPAFMLYQAWKTPGALTRDGSVEQGASLSPAPANDAKV